MKLSQNFGVIIIGGGLAGLCSAIHLRKQNISVLVIEKNNYPKHKVCGEYISNEVLPYLNYLGVDVFKLGAKRITKFELSTASNKLVKANLPLGGFGISRYLLDNHLAEKAKKCGVQFLNETATSVAFKKDEFNVKTKNSAQLKSKFVIGAYGKRANLDVQLNRTFITNKSPYLAVKTHVKGNFDDDLIALHNFKGGYCGASMVEDNSINLCYITDYKAFKKYKNIDDFQEKVVFKNTYLRDLFKNSTPVFEKPLTISQVSFDRKNPIENHIIMCGDSAGMIHPLCGNGMSMAIRSAQIASELILSFYNNEISSRKELEKLYRKQWNAEFSLRLKAGHTVANLFNRSIVTDISAKVLQIFPNLVAKIIKLTHGKPMLVK